MRESDLVNRLRDRSYASKAKDRLCEEAADEIERLQKELQDTLKENQQLLLERLRAMFAAPFSEAT
jgi:peptidoglycan hydrolase CwlO-like protein